MSLGAFGTGALFIESSAEGLRYRSIHLGEICIAETNQGGVDTVFRKFQLTARQAVQRFGASVLPDKIAAEDKAIKVNAAMHLAISESN